MTDHIADAATKLRKRLAELDAEMVKTRKALAALEALSSERHTGQRARHVSYPVKCSRCGSGFEMKRRPRALNYCHKPCTSSIHSREVAARESKTKEDGKAKAAVLVKGDPLRAGH